MIARHTVSGLAVIYMVQLSVTAAVIIRVN